MCVNSPVCPTVLNSATKLSGPRTYNMHRIRNAYNVLCMMESRSIILLECYLMYCASCM